MDFQQGPLTLESLFGKIKFLRTYVKMLFSIDTVLQNPSEQYEVLRSTFKLGTFYGLRTRTTAMLVNMKITEAGLVMIDFYVYFCLLLPDMI